MVVAGLVTVPSGGWRASRPSRRASTGSGPSLDRVDAAGPAASTARRRTTTAPVEPDGSVTTVGSSPDAATGQRRRGASPAPAAATRRRREREAAAATAPAGGDPPATRSGSGAGRRWRARGARPPGCRSSGSSGVWMGDSSGRSRSRARMLRLRTAPSLTPSSCGDLADAAVLEVAQDQHGPVRRRQPGERLGDQQLQVGRRRRCPRAAVRRLGVRQLAGGPRRRRALRNVRTSVVWAYAAGLSIRPPSRGASARRPWPASPGRGPRPGAGHRRAATRTGAAEENAPGRTPRTRSRPFDAPLPLPCHSPRKILSAGQACGSSPSCGPAPSRPSSRRPGRRRRRRRP